MDDFRIWMLLVTVVLSLVALAFRPWIDAIWRSLQERKALKGELEDLNRHFAANRRVIDTINPDRGMPLDMHFRKLTVPDTIILFSDDAFRHLPRDWLQSVFQLRLMIRNFNIEVEDALAAAQNDRRATLKALLPYLGDKTGVVRRNINALYRTFYKKPLRPAAESPPPRILYREAKPKPKPGSRPRPKPEPGPES